MERALTRRSASWTRTLGALTVAALVLAPAGLAAGASAGPTGTPSALAAGVASSSSRPLGPPNTWVPTGPMHTPRAGQTATLLQSGEVLVAGGEVAKSQLYDPATGSFSATASMPVAEKDATATLLPDGDVLVAGGRQGGKQLSTAELYHPGSGTWTPTGSMHVARSGQTATLLPDGDVLVAGGGCNGQAYGCDAGSFLRSLSSAELYDPATGTWALTGSMKEGRQFFTATPLPDGKVLAVGGFNNCDDDFCFDLSSAELYDPTSGTWSSTGSLVHGPREQQTATLLADGEVLVAGGFDEGGDNVEPSSYADTELYDPSTGVWSETSPLPATHFGQTATLLPNGWVLVAGGQSADAQVYEPRLGIWVATGSMSTPRTDATATLLPDDRVLVTGGRGPDAEPQATAELYLIGASPLVTLDPATLAFGVEKVGATGAAQSFTVVNNGSANLFVSGVTVAGANPGDFRARAACRAAVPPGGSCTVSVRFVPTGIELRTADVGVVDNAPLSPQAAAVSGYGNGPGAWVPTGSMTTPRSGSTATALPGGDVLVAGGEDGVGNSLSSAELYDTTTGTFTATGSLVDARGSATATLLPDGQVLVAGGQGSGPEYTDLSSAELYDPATGTWRLTGSMLDPGYRLSSVLLPDGDVLVEGIVSGTGAELYDPAMGSWSATGPLPAPGAFSTATVLPDGDVLAAGGGSRAAALYDPASNRWTATGDMVATQLDPTATLLQDGEVLVAGGNSPSDDPLATSELYHPSKGTWALTEGPMNVPREGQTATLLADGDVLVAGGCKAACDSHDVTATTELFLADDGYWAPLGPMTQPRYDPSATLLANGDVLVAGGSNYCCRTYATAETFTP